MRHTLPATLLALFVATFAQSLHANDDTAKAANDDVAQAQKLIDRAIKAIGGNEALEKTRNTILEDKGTYFGMGDGLPYEGRYVFDFSDPGRFRMEILGIFVSVVDKDTGWTSAMGTITDLKGEALEAAKESVFTGYVISLIPLQKPNKDFKLSLVGTETVEDEKCEGVNVDREGMPTCTIYFSQKTGLIKKTRTTTKAAELGYKEVQDETVYHEYKKLNGVLGCAKMTSYRDGKKFVESSPHTVSYPDKIDEKEFKKPE